MFSTVIGSSDLTATARKTIHSILGIVVALAIVIVSVNAAAFALCPAGSKSEVVWTEYRNQESLDTIVLGTSLMARSLDPEVVDDHFATHSFNMSTPSQSVSESYVALREVLDNHDIKRVVYGVDFSALWPEYWGNVASVFMAEKWKGDAPWQRFEDMSYILTDYEWMLGATSINWAFPWVQQRVGPGEVADNVRMKLDGTPVTKAAEYVEDGWIYHGQGYGNYNAVFDYNADHHKSYRHLGMSPLKEENLNYLADICDLCNQRGVEFVAMVPPVPDFTLITMKDHYAEYTRQVKELVESHGGLYLDFNLAKPDVFESRESYFQDFEHMNYEGAAVLSDAFVELVKEYESTGDVSAHFMSYDERIAGIDHIAIADLTDKVTESGIELHASCATGTNVIPEYQFLVDSGSGYEVVQDYSTSDSCLYVPPANGEYKVRVNIRKQGSDVEFEKHTQHSVAYAAGSPPHGKPHENRPHGEPGQSGNR